MQSIPVREGLFELDADGAGRLLGGRCGACGRHHFPASDLCPYCAADGCQRQALSTQGVLCLFTTVVNRPPGYDGELPFGFGVVELPEGLRVVTRLTETDPSRLRQGQAMRLVVTALHTDDDGTPVVSYAYAPEDA